MHRCLLALLIMPQLAQATDRLVPSEYRDISAALTASNSNDRILVDALTYTGEFGLIDHLIIFDSVRIEGVNGQPTVPGIAVAGSFDIELASLRLDGPILDAGIVAVYRQSGGTLDVDSVTLLPTANAPGFYLLGGNQSFFKNFTATGFSSNERPIEIRDGSTSTIKDSYFAENRFGAVIASAESQLTIDGGAFTDNFAGRGADLEILNRSSVEVKGGTTFTGATTQNGGGSMYISRSSADISDATFTDIGTDGAGGAIFATMTQTGADAGDAPYPVVIRNSKFTRIAAHSQGGVLLLNNMDTLIEDVGFSGTAVVDDDLTDTTRSEGGAIAAGSGNLEVRRSTFEGFSNHSGNGGAISMLGSAFTVDSGTALIEDSVFTGDPMVTETGRGGALNFADANVVLNRLTLTDLSTDRLGGAIYVTQGALVATEVDIRNVSTVGLGGAYRAQLADLTITDGIVRDIAAPSGAIVAFGEGGAHTLDITGGWFEGLTLTNNGAAILIDGAYKATILQNRICDAKANAAVNGDAVDGSMVQFLGDLVTDSDFKNNIVLGGGSGIQAIVRRGTADSTAAASGVLRVENNTLLETRAVDIWQGSAFIDNNILGHSAIGVRTGGFAGDVRGNYNLWWEVTTPATPANANIPGPSALFGDPLLVGYQTAACDLSGFLDPDSIARDAGDPNQTDADGSPLDIGATGGNGSILDDLDQDGVTEDLDCDDNNPDVFPGNTEDWSDDIDNDCDGNALDQDGDGFDRGVDCDDTNPSMHPLATDQPNDNVDQNCNGQDATAVVGGSCTHAPLAPTGWLLLGLAAAIRRRASR